MLTWEIKYRPNNSYWIEAKDSNSWYVFTTHAIERLQSRTTNLTVTADLEKPVRRIVKCLNHYRVDNWIMQHDFGERLIVHDVDINMVYVLVCKVNKYEIISTFNEFWEKYDNTHGTPELWLSLRKYQ